MGTGICTCVYMFVRVCVCVCGGDHTAHTDLGLQAFDFEVEGSVPGLWEFSATLGQRTVASILNPKP